MRFSPAHCLGIGLLFLSVACSPAVGTPPEGEEVLPSAELAELHNEMLELVHRHDHLTGHRLALAENLSAAAREVARRHDQPGLDPGRAEVSRIMSDLKPTLARLFERIDAGGSDAIPKFALEEGIEWDARNRENFEAVYAASDEFWGRHPGFDALGREADPEDDNNDLKIRTADAFAGTATGLAGYPYLVPFVSVAASAIAEEILEGEEDPLSGCCNCPATCGGTDP